MARPVDPKTPYRIVKHIMRDRGKAYASTRRQQTSDKSGKTYTAYVHWGTVDNNNCFHPNREWLLLSPEEKDKFEFPADWDLSELDRLPTTTGRAANVERGTDRFFGDIWLMEGIADKTGIRSDLNAIFDDNNELVDDVLTLAMFPYLSELDPSHLAAWQKLGKFPARHSLHLSEVTRIEQHISEVDRSALVSKRIERDGKDGVFAVDTTTVKPSTSDNDAVWGKNPEISDIDQAIEIVAYSRDTNMPVYYRQLETDKSDVRSFWPILAELETLGVDNVTLVSDRGGESTRNIQMCIQRGQSLITDASAWRRKVLKKIESFGVFDCIPESMTPVPGTNLYAQQYAEHVNVACKMGELKESQDMRLNLYFDPMRRTQEVLELQKLLFKQEEELKNRQKARIPLLDEERRDFRLFSVERDPETKQILSWERDTQKIRKARRAFGFSALISLGMDANAGEVLALYRQKAGQEEYFANACKVAGSNATGSVSIDRETGNQFIMFVSMMLVAYLKQIWKTTLLHDLFPYSFGIIEEMRRIRCFENGDTLKLTMPFLMKQLAVCEAFGLKPPVQTIS